MAANDETVQRYANERVRVRAEQVRDLLAALEDDLATIADIYTYLNGAGSGWTDDRTDGPPHLLTASDILAYNTFATDLKTAITGNAQYATITKSCVRGV